MLFTVSAVALVFFDFDCDAVAHLTFKPDVTRSLLYNQSTHFDLGSNWLTCSHLPSSLSLHPSSQLDLTASVWGSSHFSFSLCTGELPFIDWILHIKPYLGVALFDDFLLVIMHIALLSWLILRILTAEFLVQQAKKFAFTTVVAISVLIAITVLGTR